MEPSVTVDRTGSIYTIQIGTEAFEVHVAVPGDQVERFDRVRSTPWLTGALQIGTVAGTNAWWSVGDAESDNNRVTILVGHDDQTWEVAFELPAEVIDTIISETAQTG